MHIVFVVGSYYPHYSAVGKCAGNIADELSKEHTVTVICEKNILSQRTIEVYNRQKIIRILTKEKQARINYENKIQKARGLKNKLENMNYKLYKITRVLKTVFSNVSLKKELVHGYTDALKNIDQSIDLIIPTCMPFESVVAAAQYRTEYDINVQIIPYLFDHFTENENLHRLTLNKIIKRKKHIKIELDALKKTTAILAMHSLKTHFKESLPHLSNVYYMEHPLIVRPKVDTINGTNDKIIISYVGSLLKDYVTPDYLLKVYSRTAMNNTILNFYIRGNCASDVDNYIKQFPNNIMNHGSVDKETANRVIYNSDILISIAEKKGLQMSSKIFDYISFGKPFIHFYTSENDVNLKILKKYPNVLCLKQREDQFEENVKAFTKFCIDNIGKKITFEEIESLYKDATPKYAVEIIESLTDRV